MVFAVTVFRSLMIIPSAGEEDAAWVFGFSTAFALAADVPAPKRPSRRLSSARPGLGVKVGRATRGRPRVAYRPVARMSVPADNRL